MVVSDDDDAGLSAPPLELSFASDDDANARSEGESLRRHRRDVAGGRETGGEETEARPAMQGSRLAVTAALVKRSIVYERDRASLLASSDSEVRACGVRAMR